MKNIKLLHITAHLGGGVGRALSRIAIQRKRQGLPVEETFLCLETPENKQFINALQKADINLVIAPNPQETERLISSSDITQIEWWHHPLLAGWVCERKKLKTRLIIWSHISGLYYPSIPQSFLSFPHLFLFTTPVSKTIPHLQSSLSRLGKNRVDVVHSSGGFDDFPVVKRGDHPRPLRYCYIGTFNFAKLHPDILQYIKAVNTPNFLIDFYGDHNSNVQFESYVKNSDLKNKIFIHGYTNNPSEILQKADVFVYLLNPNHYGTTENALLEAMASGVVPVVLNNPIESSIVCNGRTGLVVDSPKAFSEAINYLNKNPQKRYELSVACCKDIRKRFALSKIEKELRDHYLAIMDQDKKDFYFCDAFGHSPSEWFSACLGQFEWCFKGNINNNRIRSKRLQNPFLYEKSKSSIYHFLRYYPDCLDLKQWKEILDQDIELKNNKL